MNELENCKEAKNVISDEELSNISGGKRPPPSGLPCYENCMKQNKNSKYCIEFCKKE